MRKISFLIVLLLFNHAGFSQVPELEQYNIVWETQSRNSSESMPCGGGDIGLNVWVENGDILFYMARSGTFDENNTMLKLGRVRIRLSPNPLAGEVFRQVLDLSEGSVKIFGRRGDNSATITLWVDVFSPVIHVDIESDRRIEAEAVYESWRYRDHLIRKNEGFGNFYKWAVPEGLMTKKDRIAFTGDTLLFYHRNEGETVFDVTVEQQHLGAVKDQLFDPLHNLTFGGRMQGVNFVPAGTSEGSYLTTGYRGWKLKSRKPAKEHALDIFLHTGQYESLNDWQSALNHLVSQVKYSLDDRRKNSLNWWEAFWNRSFIFIAPENDAEDSARWQVGRNYQLFRYLLGCNAYGQYPTKFNGGLFTVDPQFTDSTKTFKWTE